jgi:hypothetical protein
VGSTAGNSDVSMLAAWLAMTSPHLAPIDMLLTAGMDWQSSTSSAEAHVHIPSRPCMPPAAAAAGTAWQTFYQAHLNWHAHQCLDDALYCTLCAERNCATASVQSTAELHTAWLRCRLVYTCQQPARSAATYRMPVAHAAVAAYLAGEPPLQCLLHSFRVCIYNT